MTAGSPRVCVVVPAFEAMAYLPQALASVLEQTYDDLEVVVVDDGSTDGVQGWVEGLGHPAVRCVRQPHGGQASARNRGLAESGAELVALLDADDVWDPTKLEQQVAVLDAHPDVGLVHCGVRFVDHAGAPLNRPLAVTGHGPVWDQIVLSNSTAGVKCGSTPLIRRACFDDVGHFDTDLTYSEDWDMWLRIASRWHYSALDQTLVSYRQHATNVTRNYQEIVANQTAVLDKTFAAHPDAPPSLRRSAYGQSLVFASWRAHLVEEHRAAVGFLRSAVARHPGVLRQPNTLKLALRLLRSSGRRAVGLR